MIGRKIRPCATHPQLHLDHVKNCNPSGGRMQTAIPGGPKEAREAENVVGGGNGQVENAAFRSQDFRRVGRLGANLPLSLSRRSCMHGWIGYRRPPRQGDIPVSKASTVWSDFNPARVHPLWRIVKTPRVFFFLSVRGSPLPFSSNNPSSSRLLASMKMQMTIR